MDPTLFFVQELDQKPDNQPLTAPTTTPLTMYFCKKMNTTIEGNTAMTIAVIAYCQSEVY